MKKWFVVQTMKGQENKVAREIRDDIVKKDEAVFIFENEMEYKIKGEWIKDRKPFFPGYLFVELEESNVLDFNERLHRKKRKLMSVDGVIIPIKPEEEDYLKRLGGDEHVFAYGTSGAMTPVAMGDEVAFSGRLHCLTDAVTY